MTDLLPDAPDFVPALGDLQEALPSWLAIQNPGSEMYKVASAVAEVVDMLSELWERPHLDQVITTASPEGLLHNFAFAWGLQNERLPTVAPSLVAFMQALATDDGSLRSMINCLTTLLYAEENITGGEIVNFPAVQVPAIGLVLDGGSASQVGSVIDGGSASTTEADYENGQIVSGGDAAGTPVTRDNSFEDLLLSYGPSGWWKLNEPAGSTVAADASGNTMTGTVTGPVTFGSVGPLVDETCARFSDAGAVNYIEAPLSTPEAAVSIVGLFTPTASPGSGGVFGWRDSDTNTEFYVLQLPGDSGQLECRFTPGSGAAATLNPTVAVGQQHLVALTYDGSSTVTAYVDGQPAGSAAASGILGAYDVFRIGRDQNGNQFNGPVAQVAALPTCLTADQVAALWQATGALTFPADGSGITLFQFGPGDSPSTSEGLVFPTDGSGLHFPASGDSAVDDHLIVNNGQPAIGSGPGLVFSQNQFVEIIPDLATSTMLVKVQAWMNFDRGAFARAVQRFQDPTWLPTVIEEVPTF